MPQHRCKNSPGHTPTLTLVLDLVATCLHACCARRCSELLLHLGQFVLVLVLCVRCLKRRLLARCPQILARTSIATMAAVPQPITDIKATYNDVVPPGMHHVLYCVTCFRLLQISCLCHVPQAGTIAVSTIGTPSPM